MISDMLCANETVGGCPHIYDFYDGDTIVGTLRYRWGHFQLYPVDEGADLDNIIDVSISKEMGILPYENRDEIIEYCKDILCDYYNVESLPDDRNYYIQSLLETD